MILHINKVCSVLFISIASFQNLYAQELPASNRSTENLLVQFNKTQSIEYGKFDQDSLKLVLQVKEKDKDIPSIYFIKAKILGDSSGFILSIPSDAKKEKATWLFSEYIATASTGANFIEAKEYANFSYSPFDFEFLTLPPKAEIYLVPLYDWKVKFNREDINFQFSSYQLSLISGYKILQLTPCHYFVFEQPYIGVFVGENKIQLAYINPKRNTPNNNKAEIKLTD